MMCLNDILHFRHASSGASAILAIPGVLPVMVRLGAYYEAL